MESVSESSIHSFVHASAPGLWCLVALCLKCQVTMPDNVDVDGDDDDVYWYWCNFVVVVVAGIACGSLAAAAAAAAAVCLLGWFVACCAHSTLLLDDVVVVVVVVIGIGISCALLLRWHELSSSSCCRPW